MNVVDTQDRFVPFEEAQQMLGVGYRAMRRYIVSGTLPQPVRFSRSRQGWALSTLQRVLRGEKVQQP